jgi:two-component system sensor kinase FixL
MSVGSKDSGVLVAGPNESATPIARLATSAAMRVALTHELSQPLSALATYIHAGRRLLKVEELDRDRLAETMRKAETEIKRARDVLKKLRGFITREKAERLPVNLLDLIRTEAARLGNEAMARAVSIAIEPGSLPIVMADPVQIRQVLVNLLSNAIDAAAGARNAIVRVRCRHDSGTIEIVVDDNGRGVALEIAEHLFEPFQTTKTRGMGLGLPLSRQIIEAHGGRIWWERKPPRGTRFHVLLPVEPPARYDT